MTQTASLHDLPEIQEIADYLHDMKFKRKVIGGCDPESVLDHFQAVTLRYEAIIAYLLEQEKQAGGQQKRGADFVRRQQGMVKMYVDSIRASL